MHSVTLTVVLLIQRTAFMMLIGDWDPAVLYGRHFHLFHWNC